MALIADSLVKIFDLTAIKRGDCVRVRRTGETVGKNGFVTKITEKTMQIQVCGTQNNTSNYMDILASDVAAGVWEVWWTTDFTAVNHEYNGALEIDDK